MKYIYYMDTEMQIKKLNKKREKQLSLLNKSSYFLKGSINDICAKCKRAKCTCDIKTSNRNYRLTYKDSEQKTKIIYIRQKQLSTAKKMIKNYEQLRKLIDELLAINIEIFKLPK